jgi:purine-cytosine permease-like protein
MAALLWSGVIPTVGLQTWHSLFMLVCGPACLLMIAEMLAGFGAYSGRARHPHSAA